MASTKFLQIQHDADLARCYRKTANLPELARRYLKHCPNQEEGELYQTILLCEHRLNQLVDSSGFKAPRSAFPPTSPTTIATPPTDGPPIGCAPHFSESVGCLPSHAGQHSETPSSESVLPTGGVRPSADVPPRTSTAFSLLDAAVPRRSWALPAGGVPFEDPKAYVRQGTAWDALQPSYCPPKPMLHPAFFPDVAEIQSVLSKVKAQAKRHECLNNQYKMLMALTYFYTGQEGKCCSVLTTVPEFLKSSVAPEYTRVLTLQRFTLLGICAEASDRAVALALYEKALNFYRTIQNPSAVHELLYWYHEALYRCCLLRLSQPIKEPGIVACRAYIQQSQEWPTNFQAHCRIVLITQLIRTLSDAYRSGQYLPASATQPLPNGRPSTTSVNTPNTVVFYPTTYKNELVTLYQRYEALLAVVYRFPQAHETYMPIIDMVDQAVKDWEAMGADSRTDMHTLVQMLYRMSRYTYNSLHVYRHLVHSLIRYGDYLEAELALHAYWGECKRYLEQKRVSGTADKSGGDSSAPEAADRLATDMTQLTVEPVVPERRSSLLRGQRGARNSVYSQRTGTGGRPAPLPEVEQESVSDMVQTLVVGAHMLNTYLDKFRDSHDIIEAALALSKEPGSNLPGRLLAQVHHQMGVSASQICLRAEDPEKRAKYQELALQSYRKAIDLDSSDAEIHYHYALQYAVSRNTEQAVLTVKQAIGLRPDHLNAWNLLALLISSQKDYHRALKICEVGCRESEWCDIDAEIQQAVLSHVDNGPVTLNALANFNHSPEDGEAYLSLKITQCLIYELLHGPQSAVQLHSILFSLYGRIYGQEAGSHPQNHTALISMTLTHRPLLAGFAASPGSPSHDLIDRGPPDDVLSAPDLSRHRSTSHRGARALISRSTRTVHMATSEGRLLAKMARDKVRGKRRNSLAVPPTAGGAEGSGSGGGHGGMATGSVGKASGKDASGAATRFNGTIRDLPRINFQSSVSVNSYALPPGHRPSASTGSPWLQHNQSAVVVGSGYTGGSVNTNHLVSATTASGRPSSSAGVVPLLPPTSGGEKSESGEPPNSGSQDGKSRSGDGTGTGTAAGTVVGTAPGTGTGTRTGGGTGSRSDTTKELYKTTLRRQRARKTLADLWLISAAVFRRLGRMKDAQAAIGEAENVYPDYPAVWCQYGLLMVAYENEEYDDGGGSNDAHAFGGDSHSGTCGAGHATTGSSNAAPWLSEHADSTEPNLNGNGGGNNSGGGDKSKRRDPSHQNVAAIRHFLTGVALGPQDIPTRVHLARAYMRLNKAAIATGLLQEVTRGTGWDVAEAWTLLAQTTLGEGKVQLANEYLVFALELENAKPIRPFQALSW
ncbi:hypothetical protein H4R33_004413 [Dimargaris cristalligena]|nr:hypothetical protein H4R33_004413 [Dimargaris cristalligena]